MTDTDQTFLVISRGQWNPDTPRDEVQASIDAFYGWLQAHVAAGRMRLGSRLEPEGATVTRKGVVMDGPFGETKELVGGYWLAVAPTLEQAAKLLADSPMIAQGLFYEVRPFASDRATAAAVATETR